jgi:hypothetical protein
MNTFSRHSLSARSNLQLFAAGVIALLASVHMVSAQLQWDTQSLDRAPGIADTKAEAVFGFVNAGKGSITIDAVEPSSGCSVVPLAKTSYAPGERGQLLATFHIGAPKGKQSAVIRVTSEGGKKTDNLSLNVLIPEIATVLPPLLSWEANAKADFKTVDVLAAPGRTLQILKATANPSNLKTRIETVKEGAHYRVAVAPEDTSKGLFSRLDIVVLADGVEKRFSTYLRVGAGGPGMPVSVLRSTVTEGADALDVEPEGLFWSQTEGLAAKYFTVRTPPGRHLKVRKVWAGNPEFESSFAQVQANEYRVSVKPRSLETRRSTLVTVEADSGEGTAKVLVPAQIGF